MEAGVQIDAQVEVGGNTNYPEMPPMEYAKEVQVEVAYQPEVEIQVDPIPIVEVGGTTDLVVEVDIQQPIVAVEEEVGGSHHRRRQGSSTCGNIIAGIVFLIFAAACIFEIVYLATYTARYYHVPVWEYIIFGASGAICLFVGICMFCGGCRGSGHTTSRGYHTGGQTVYVDNGYQPDVYVHNPGVVIDVGGPAYYDNGGYEVEYDNGGGYEVEYDAGGGYEVSWVHVYLHGLDSY